MPALRRSCRWFIGTTMANVDGAGHEEEVEEGLEH